MQFVTIQTVFLPEIEGMPAKAIAVLNDKQAEVVWDDSIEDRDNHTAAARALAVQEGLSFSTLETRELLDCHIHTLL